MLTQYHRVRKLKEEALYKKINEFKHNPEKEGEEGMIEAI